MRLKEKIISSAPVQFEKHQPERRRGIGTYLFCGGCCCCLHTLGGLIGATVATVTIKSAPGGSVAGGYWTCLALLTAAIFLVASGSTVEFGVIATLLFLPLAQLGLSLLMFFWIQARSADVVN